MRCRFCSEEMAEGEIRCSVCGFTHMNFTETGGSEVIKNMLSAYRQRKLGNIRVELISYKYRMENGKINDLGEELIAVAQADKLEKGRLSWLDKDFYGIQTERNIDLKIRVTGGEKREQTVTLKLPVCEKLNIGCVLENGLKIRIAAGTPENYVLSDMISLC